MTETTIGAAALGPADVSDEQLAGMVAENLGVASAEVLTRWVRPAPYTDEAIFTAGRYLVDGLAATGAGPRPYAFFVKVVRSWRRSPGYAKAPPDLRDAVGEPAWRAEIDFYRSGLRDLLPAGLTAPRAHAVLDLDDESAALWLEHVPARDVRWDAARYAGAARLLGRLAATAMPAPAAARTPRNYADTWLAHVALPALWDDAVWAHPLVTPAFDEPLLLRIRAAARDLPRHLDELDALPHGPAHGDACPANLLVTGGGLTLVDFGFFSHAPLGADLGQLVLAEIQAGLRPVHELAGLERRCLPAFVRGLRDEGCRVPLRLVRRAHALYMLVFAGLAAVPVEHLDSGPTPALHRAAAARAAAARFVLDLVDSG